MSNSEHQPRHTPLRPVTGVLPHITFSVLVLSLVARETLLQTAFSLGCLSTRRFLDSSHTKRHSLATPKSSRYPSL
jgi:hypothetical protein